MPRSRDERPVAALPWWIPGLVVAATAAQLAWPRLLPEPRTGAAREPLPSAPPPAAVLRVAALGEEAAFARLAVLWLQSEDGGAHGLPYRSMDYGRLGGWLRALIALDPPALYPLFAAVRVYAENPDEGRTRQMLDLVATAFAEDPDRRWPAMAHAALLAKHRLNDLPLARRYAAALQQRTTGAAVPLWARQMEAFILEDMNELEAAKIMLGGMLASGHLQDEGERRFLESRLRALEERLRGSAPPPANR